MYKKGLTPEFDICCPNCQQKGDFLRDINSILKNCIEFCEFPHKCTKQSEDGQKKEEVIIWKTLGELQKHAQYNCPKFGCDICYKDEFQNLTRTQLYEHIKNDCSQVRIMCQLCNQEFKREEFRSHYCMKEEIGEKTKEGKAEIFEMLVDKLILHKRYQEGLGLCSNHQCVERHRASDQRFQTSMIQEN